MFEALTKPGSFAYTTPAMHSQLTNRLLWCLALASCAIGLALPNRSCAQESTPGAETSSASQPAAPAVAPTAAATSGRASRAEARRLYEQAQGTFEAGDFAASEAQFSAAYQASPNPRVLLGLAAAQERQGKLVETRATLTRYLAEYPGAADREAIEARLAAMPVPSQPILPGRLHLSGNPAGASVVVDGQLTDFAFPGDIEVSPGPHAIEIRADGYEPFNHSLTIAPGEEQGLVAELVRADGLDQPLETPVASVPAGSAESDPLEVIDPAAPQISDAVWVATGIAAATLVAGTVFGFVALDKQSAFDQNPNADTASSGETFALLADLSFGVALGAGVTALVLYLTDRPAQAAAAPTESADPDGVGEEPAPASATSSFQWSPSVSPRHAGAQVSFTF